MNKKVILINAIISKEYKPNPEDIFRMRRGPHFPLGIAQIGSYLKKKMPKVSVTLLDDQILSYQEMIKKIKSIKPDIVGINSVFANHEKVLVLARESKKSGAKVVMGGYYPSTVYKEILINRGKKSDDYCVDIVIRGDGEEPFYQYASGKPLPDINSIAYYQENSLKVNRFKSASSVQYFPDPKVINPEIYFSKYQERFPNLKYKRPFIVQSQKGCTWRAKPGGGCLFCSLVDKKYSAKTPKAIWSEMDRLVDEYKINYIWDVSDNLLGEKKWFNQYYEESKKYKNRPYLKIQSRVNSLINEDVIKKLSDMKVGPVFVGIESNDDRCLKSMKKGTTSLMNEKAVKLLSKYAIPINAYFVLGNPGEDKKSLARTVKLAEKIMKLRKDNIIVPLLFSPLPNSLSYQMVLAKTGKKYRGKDVINWWEMIEDWAGLYCKASHKEIIETQRYLRRLPSDINAFSF